MQLSIIIPVLNDSPALGRLLTDLAAERTGLSMEVVVVDGGSDDVLTNQLPSFARYLRAPRGRGQQLAAGVDATSGRVIWFLHADTRLPRGAATLVASQTGGWGRMRLRFEPDFPGMRMVAALMHWRSRLTGICTGDQGIWVWRDVLDQAGGVPPQTLMEDIELSTRLRRQAWPTVLSETLVTSSRRWRDGGLIATILMMWRLRLAYFFGESPERLAHRYAAVRETSLRRRRHCFRRTSAAEPESVAGETPGGGAGEGDK